MNIKNVISIGLLLFSVSLAAGCRLGGVKAQVPEPVPEPQVETHGARVWRPAIYKGLTVGQSTSADMVRVFGEPKWAVPPAGQSDDDPDPAIWYGYENVGDFAGQLSLIVNKHSGVILSIENSPTELSMKQAIAYFGDDYIVTRYAFDQCLGDDESAPMYESPDGNGVYVEYRDRGIAISISYDDRVNSIIYVDRPMGATSSQCNGKQAKTGSIQRKSH